MVLRDRQRLEKIAEYCEDIQAAVARYGSAYDTFQSDRDFQHSVSFCILQIGELVGGLTEEYRSETKNHVQWRQIKGMRNLVAHDYGGINLEIVWDVATEDIPNLLRFCKSQLADAE